MDKSLNLMFKIAIKKVWLKCKRQVKFRPGFFAKGLLAYLR